MELGKFVTTVEGTPQGGIISPTLCNVALNGIEKVIKDANPNKKGISAGVHLIRYADDMIVTGKNEAILLKCKEILKNFLAIRGLQLNEKKTKITHIRTGIDFLGFNIRRMKYNSRLNKKTEQKTVLIIKPSLKGIKKLMDTVKSKINIEMPMEAIVKTLNPILRG